MANRVLMQYFEWYTPSGILWKKMAAEADRLARLGVGALWIPPAYKGMDGADDVGYAVYDLYDLGEFDQKGGIPTKYGTKDELLQAVEAAHANGLAVYADIVLDHKLGADGTEIVKAEEYNNDNRLEKESGPQQIEVPTLYDFPGRRGKYSDFVWHWRHFTGVDRDESEDRDGVFKFVGKHWAQKVDRENGNYDYLMGASLDLNNPEVCEELKRWGVWFVNQTGVDGFRLDAVKHMKFTFHSEWLHAMRRHFGKEFFTVGEYWSKDLDSLLDFLQTTDGALSLFDVPLHYRFFWASLGGSAFDLRTMFDNTLTAVSAVKSVTFVDNHDSQPGQALESWVRDWFKPHAYALILLREAGFPCVFYGDFYGIPHDNLAGKAVLVPLLEARMRYAYGPQQDYFGDRNLIGWTREGVAERDGSGLAVLVCNGAGGWKKMRVGQRHAGAAFIDIAGYRQERVVLDADGAGSFPVGEDAISVWAREDAARRDLPGELFTAIRKPYPRDTAEETERLRVALDEAREAGQEGVSQTLAGLLEERTATRG